MLSSNMAIGLHRLTWISRAVTQVHGDTVMHNNVKKMLALNEYWFPLLWNLEAAMLEDSMTSHENALYYSPGWIYQGCTPRKNNNYNQGYESISTTTFLIKFTLLRGHLSSTMFSRCYHKDHSPPLTILLSGAAGLKALHPFCRPKFWSCVDLFSFQRKWLL